MYAHLAYNHPGLDRLWDIQNILWFIQRSYFIHSRMAVNARCCNLAERAFGRAHPASVALRARLGDAPCLVERGGMGC